jgi:hypothetical protein
VCGGHVKDDYDAKVKWKWVWQNYHVGNIHTCSICRPYLFVVGLALLHHQLLEFTGGMICSTGVKIPIWICTTGWGGHGSNMFIWNEVFIKLVPTVVDSVPHFKAWHTWQCDWAYPTASEGTPEEWLKLLTLWMLLCDLLEGGLWPQPRDRPRLCEAALLSARF